jgi:hypothetical protein
VFEKKVQTFEDFDGKWAFLVGQGIGELGGGGQYSLFELVYISEKMCALWRISCQFARIFLDADLRRLGGVVWSEKSLCTS